MRKKLLWTSKELVAQCPKKGEETPVSSGVFGRLNAGCGYERHGGGMGFWVFLTPGFEAEQIRSTKIPEYHNSFSAPL